MQTPPPGRVILRYELVWNNCPKTRLGDTTLDDWGHTLPSPPLKNTLVQNKLAVIYGLIPSYDDDMEDNQSL